MFWVWVVFFVEIIVECLICLFMNNCLWTIFKMLASSVVSIWRHACANWTRVRENFVQLKLKARKRENPNGEWLKESCCFFSSFFSDKKKKFFRKVFPCDDTLRKFSFHSFSDIEQTLNKIQFCQTVNLACVRRNPPTGRSRTNELRHWCVWIRYKFTICQ